MTETNPRSSGWSVESLDTLNDTQYHYSRDHLEALGLSITCTAQEWALPAVPPAESTYNLDANRDLLLERFEIDAERIYAVSALSISHTLCTWNPAQSHTRLIKVASMINHCFNVPHINTLSAGETCKISDNLLVTRYGRSPSSYKVRWGIRPQYFLEGMQKRLNGLEIQNLTETLIGAYTNHLADYVRREQESRKSS